MRALRQNGIAQSIVACYIVVSSHTRFTTNSPRHPTRPPKYFYGRRPKSRRAATRGAHALSCVPTEKPQSPTRDARESSRVEHTTPPDLSLDP